ncbi:MULTISPECIES: glutathione S-transferase family protein [Phyllobacterium]|uniref:Glutathione S-transferase n=1 Tax=Phyllobacterium sophorae TaxID=1520277 RepID=A0A2P7BBW4_9HYPH|nr:MULTISPECIES: glutathione S-transferase family protein [Phyllobacterium]PSH63954.1 glutathione S-transferase [Phyllobacterium sophorae]UXN63225.1 glutathione S-transferase family protein [Phyllobacterium sp. A18/5-2]
MEPVLFYGVPHGCSFGSIVALEWLGQPYRLSRIDMLAKTKSNIYGRVNSHQQTPALLLEEGKPLSESFAILQNIAARDLSLKLGFAQGTKESDRLNQMLAYLHTSFHSAFASGWVAFKLKDGDPAIKILRDLAREKAAEGYAYLQTHMKGREWLVGDSKTIADAYLIGIARWGEDLRLFDLKVEYPGLQRYLQKLETDRGVIFAHAIEDGQPAVTSGQFLGHVDLAEIEPRLAA